jgi:signal transduction histidine kinase
MARYALVVGITDYTNQLPNLTKPATDAEAVEQVLKAHGDFEDIAVLKGKVSTTKLAEALKTLLQQQAVKNEALIYFTGHGITVSDSLGTQQAYLATSDLTIVTQGKLIIEQTGGISLGSLNNLIRDSDLSSLVVLLDCCHSGEFLERNLIEKTLTAFISQRDYYFIAACRGFQQAFAKKIAQHSIFTTALLAGLSPENTNDRGQVTGDRLFDILATELKSSGQEPIRMGWGRSITLVQYQFQQTAIVIDETCPYRGLEAFNKEQARFFFGREKVTQLLIEKLGQANFVPVIGASGSGKSSVVRAGLIPALEKNGWQVLEMTPDVEPLAELRGIFKPYFPNSRKLYDYIRHHPDGLRQVISCLPTSQRFLLVVDQFEEMFTLCPKEEERRRFIELLTSFAETSRLVIVTTMRADFLEPCLNYESLTNLIQEQAVYMPPLVGAELEEAIASPANLQGYQLERGLLGAIQHEVVGQEKGCLPLLQFALTELWEQRDQQAHQLTVAKYNELGGVIGTLNRHAENLYESFTEQQQDWVKRIFLKLVRTGAQAKDTRQWQAKTKLLSIAGENRDEQQVINDVLEKLIQGRLIILDCEPTGEVWVDLAHEALMEGWERFAKWRKTGRELRRLIDRVEDALREWQEQPKDDNLMMGGLLAQVQKKWQELQSELDTTVKEFYQRSVVLAERQRQQYEAAITAKSQFVSNISHELRTPLNGMIGFLRLVLDGMADDLEEQNQFLLEAHHLSIYLLDIINDILDFAKIEAAKMTLYPENFEIGTLVNNIILTVKPVIEKNGNILEVDCNKYLGTMYADEIRMRQVLLNLLGNAAKFTTNGKVTLTVKSEQEESVQDTLKHNPLGMITFTVTDTGIGISDNLQQILFQPFITGDTSRKYRGAGLGLAISRHLCQMMGGDIFVKSELGVGSTFTVHLPRNISA